MPIPEASNSLATALQAIQSLAYGTKAQAQNAVTTLAAQSVDSDYVFRVLDQINQVIAGLNAYAGIAGLNAYATTQLPGYAGTLTADITTANSAAQGCIDWVVTNFPKDSTATFILSHVLNANGTRTPRLFTPAQTAGLRTALQTLITAL